MPVCKNWPNPSRHLQMNHPGAPSWGKIPEKLKEQEKLEEKNAWGGTGEGKKGDWGEQSCFLALIWCCCGSMTNEAQLGSTLAYPVIFSFFQPPAHCLLWNPDSAPSWQSRAWKWDFSSLREFVLEQAVEEESPLWPRQLQTRGFSFFLSPSDPGVGRQTPKIIFAFTF